MYRELVGICLLLAVGRDSKGQGPAENPLFQRLVTEGVDVGGREQIKLPLPLVAEQAGANEQRTAR